MIGPGAGARVMVATRPVDFRNYAATMIMRILVAPMDRLRRVYI